MVGRLEQCHEEAQRSGESRGTRRRRGTQDRALQSEHRPRLPPQRVASLRRAPRPRRESAAAGDCVDPAAEDRGYGFSFFPEAVGSVQSTFSRRRSWLASLRTLLARTADMVRVSAWALRVPPSSIRIEPRTWRFPALAIALRCSLGGSRVHTNSFPFFANSGAASSMALEVPEELPTRKVIVVRTLGSRPSTGRSGL